MEASIEIGGQHKRFASAVALDGMSFTGLPEQVTGFFEPTGRGSPP
jgi:hypothetical protein